jgi:hypothetical protein
MQDISGLFKRLATTQRLGALVLTCSNTGWSRSSLTLNQKPQTPCRLPPDAASPPDHPHTEKETS